VTVRVYCKHVIQKERAHNCTIADAAPRNLGIRLLELIRSCIGVLVRPLHVVMSVDDTTEIQACFFIAEKKIASRGFCCSYVFAEITHKIPDISIIAKQFMHSAFYVGDICAVGISTRQNHY
jgi:hypothetical protein